MPGGLLSSLAASDDYENAPGIDRCNGANFLRLFEVT
jgi:hypothetical protein